MAGLKRSRQESRASLAVLRQVDREAKGNRAATQAWAQITASADAEQLTTILAAMDGAGPLAANWLRAAVDAIAERHVQGKGMLPIAGLEAFLNQKQHDQRARTAGLRMDRAG